MTYKVVIPGTFASLNQYIDANRTGRGKWNKGNQMKQDDQRAIRAHLSNQLRRVHINCPVRLKYSFYEPNKKRDLDNISGYFHKVFQDALVANGVLHNDSWHYIAGFSDGFYVDAKNKRIEVEIIELSD